MVPHWKALSYGDNEFRGLSCRRNSRICQDILKSGNLLHKQGFVETQSLRNVNETKLLTFFTLSFLNCQKSAIL